MPWHDRSGDDCRESGGKPAPGAESATGPAAESQRKGLDRRLRHDARAPDHPRRRAVQPLAVLHRQGPRARHRRRARSATSSAGSTRIREAARQAPADRYIVATTRDKLLPDLSDGLADIAVGNLTVTEERLKLVDFVAPDDKLVNVEILVTGPARRRSPRSTTCRARRSMCARSRATTGA